MRVLARNAGVTAPIRHLVAEPLGGEGASVLCDQVSGGADLGRRIDGDAGPE